MILAATNVDTSSFGWAYVASVIGFVLAVATFCTVGVWLLDRAATRHLRRHVDRALDNRALTDGDRHILRAVEQREQAHRERVTVPRQFTERPHR